MKALTLLTTGVMRARPDLESADQCPRASLYEQSIATDMIDEQFLAQAPRMRRWLYRRIPTVAAQVIEAWFIRNRYDVVISWSDPHALLFSLLLKLTGKKVPHVALLFWISKPKKAALLKRVHSRIDRIVLWTSTHRDFAINVLGIPEEKISFIPYYVDQKFWRPMGGTPDMICSVGIEMRDYPTLIRAMEGVDIRCHIAAGAARGKVFDTVRAIYERGPLPANVTVGKLSPLELRALYARSRFVVIPLLPSDSDNGLTSILEAMAMGKAVICSRTKGQTDVIVDGKTGIFVPQGDPAALREAILYLWIHPDVAERMGKEGRTKIEATNTWDQFVDTIRTIAEEVVERASHPGRSSQPKEQSLEFHAARPSIPS